MPIGDLLAQIKGEKPATSPVPPKAQTPQTLPVQKRKAEGDLREDASKNPKPKPGLPVSAMKARQQAIPQKPLGRPATVQKPSPSSRPSPGLPSHLPNSKQVAARPSKMDDKPGRQMASRDSASAGTRKKESFAEIMARGQRAQAAMGQVGKIQHKSFEKGPNKQERRKMKAEAKTRAPKTPADRTAAQSKSGASRSSSPPSQELRNGSGKGTKHGKEGPAAAEKVRKPAVTTGYTGTARPRPGSAKTSKTASGGVVLNPKLASRLSGRYRDEEDDEEMDDFIDYDDDEEEDGGQRRRYYDSDGSSDMEAGLDEIDNEERRAEYIAIRDDLEEQKLERRLKDDKERRRREALEGLRNRR